MQPNRTKFTLIFVIFCLLSFGCFPNTEVTILKREAITSSTIIESPTKAYLLDASIVLFPEGFTVQNDTVIGLGQRFWLTTSDTRYKIRKTPLDSIAAMTCYTRETSAGNVVGSFLLGLWGSLITYGSIYCLTCPKCCFGSCPVVYTYDGTSRHLEAELFSHCISKQLEDGDLDLLTQKVGDDGRYQLLLTNEALETHYINRFSLLAVNHPIGTQVLPSVNGGFVTIRKPVPPKEVVNRQGKNVLGLVSDCDSLWYRSDISMVMKLSEGPSTDWLDVKVNIPQGCSKAKMVLRVRNTLLSTILLYDVVLSSQGIHALEWIDRMNRDANYASQFSLVYKAFSGIEVKVLHDGRWIQQTSISDAGPIAWKYTALEIPVAQEGELDIRLQFVPDNFMIDYIGFDYSVDAELLVDEVKPSQVRDNSDAVTDELFSLIDKDDDKYLVTEPGKSYRFLYSIPRRENNEQTLFVLSKGYYTEWIRGNWLRTGQAGYRFNLFAIDQTLAQLARSWLGNKDLIEKKFFETRIPIEEAP